MQTVIDTLPTLILFLLPLAYSPGPGNMAFAALSARNGLRATLVPTISYHLATFTVTLAFGLGAAKLGGQWSHWLKWAGTVWMLRLAWGLATAGPIRKNAKTQPFGAVGGALLLLLNPKAYAIIVLMFSQFPVTGPHDALAVTTIFTLNNMLAFFIWSLVGERLARLFSSNRAARWLNRAFGAVLAIVAIGMAFG